MPCSAMIQESELTLCARLVRAVTHHIRGDLSVITNDLTYLSALLDPDEVERARERCSHVAAIMAKVSLLGNAVEKRSLPASELLRLFGWTEATAFERARATVLDMSLVSRGVAILRDIVGPWERRESCFDDGHLFIRVSRGDLTGESKQFRSCSAFATCERREAEVIEGCLVDFIVRDHGWTIKIESYSGGFELDLRVPCKEVQDG
jgi:hypothetical protein